MFNNEKLKILVGTSDIAGLINKYAQGFRSLGYDVSTVSEYPKGSFFSDEHDIKLHQLGNLLIKKDGFVFLQKIVSVILNRIPYLREYAIKKHIIGKHDIFLYIWGQSTMLTKQKDFSIIKAQNKKLVHLFLGSDARLNEAFKQEFLVNLPSYYDNKTKSDEYYQLLSRVRKIEKYADLIYSVPDQSGVQIKPYNHLVLPYDVFNIKCKLPKRNKIPRVIHCPSRMEIKGTTHIVDAVNELKKEIEFDFELVSGVTNKEIINLLQDSDILIDELILHGPGVLSVEAMCSACVVLTRFTTKNVSWFNPPIVKVDESNLKTKLKKIILNQNLRIRIATSARKWVEENNDCTKVCSKIIDDIYSDRNITLDYQPTFFKKGFIVPDYIKND